MKFVAAIFDDDTGIHKLKKQTAKLSQIYHYHISTNIKICKVCLEVVPNTDFGKGKL